MIEPKLRAAVIAVNDWCLSHQVKYDIVCDEHNIQGVKIFSHDVVALVDAIEPLLFRENVHMERCRVRGGVILMFSLEALSEKQIAGLIAKVGETTVNFREKINQVFNDNLPMIKSSEINSPPDFLASAKKLVESQYKSATAGATRSNQSSLNRQAINTDRTLGGVEHPASAKLPSRSRRKPLAKRLDENFGTATKTKSFTAVLEQALSGIATPNDTQPTDIFAKFAKALQVLGDSMGIGPLQAKLKQQGIKWKKSDDGMSIILYVLNATTNAPQPIARISSQTLENPSDFEEQLTSMIDYAKGQAPGTQRQKQEEMRENEKTVREIAKAVGPTDDMQQQMGGQENQTPVMAAQQQPAQPAQQQPSQSAQQPAKQSVKPMRAMNQ